MHSDRERGQGHRIPARALVLIVAAGVNVLAAACGGGAGAATPTPSLEALTPSPTSIITATATATSPPVAVTAVPLDTATPPPAPTATRPAPPPAPTEPPPATPQLLIVAQDIRFSTTGFSVPSGAPVTLTLDNRDVGVLHNVAIYSPQGSAIGETPLETGPNVSSVTFTPPGPGSYTLLCTVHPRQMTGTLIVK